MQVNSSEILFPSTINFKKSPHVNFLVESARLAGMKIGKIDSDSLPVIHDGPVACILNDKPIIFDCKDWDFWCKANMHIKIPYFKSHHLVEGYNKNNTFPNVPIMTYPLGDLQEYYEFRKSFKYKCTTNIINNKQIPYGRAKDRRTNIQSLLKRTFNTVNTNNSDSPKRFWESHENCLSAVCVPGATNNMLDRGHLELIGLGVCTISPHIPTNLPYNTRLIPGIHYLRCEDDYSDLINILKWCMEHRSECETIGNNARRLFDAYLTPVKQWQWIINVTEEFYNNG